MAWNDKAKNWPDNCGHNLGAKAQEYCVVSEKVLYWLQEKPKTREPNRCGPKTTQDGPQHGAKMAERGPETVQMAAARA